MSFSSRDWIIAWVILYWPVFYQHSLLLICFLGDSKGILFILSCFSLSFFLIKSGQWTKFYSSFFQAVAKQLHRLIAWNVSLYLFPWSKEFLLLFSEYLVDQLLESSCLWSFVSNQPLTIFLTGFVECFFKTNEM